MASDIEVFGFVYDLAIVREWGRRVEAMKQLASENMIDKNNSNPFHLLIHRRVFGLHDDLITARVYLGIQLGSTDQIYYPLFCCLLRNEEVKQPSNSHGLTGGCRVITNISSRTKLKL